MYERLLEYCRQHESAAEAGKLMEDCLTQTTMTHYSDRDKDGNELEAKDKTRTKSFVEPFSHSENETHEHLFSILGGTNKSRAHLLPEDIQCRKFWGEIAELLSGADIEVADDGFRTVLVDIKDLRVNLMVFDGNHAEFFDKPQKGRSPCYSIAETRQAGCLEAQRTLPSLDCDSPEAYKLICADNGNSTMFSGQERKMLSSPQRS